MTTLRQVRLAGRAALALLVTGAVSPILVPAVTEAGPLQRSSAAPAIRSPRTRALLVGGGPSADTNQIAIESNVRFLLRVLPNDADRTVLYAAGDRLKEIVLFESTPKKLKPAERLLALLIKEREDAHPSNLKYRKPALTQIDGPSKKGAVKAAFDRLAGQPATSGPLLLYFTGHGSQTRPRDVENSQYDLWNDGGLTVKELAAEVARLPSEQPVILVMVQCYAGAFANLLFEGGDPANASVDRDIVGFFATIKERMAAGCTPEVNEAEYHDFTSYFFAALSGRDRVGRPVTGVDYNRDGRVAMDEAFCYTVINNASIDVPVCMSDIYLRKVVPTPDSKVFELGYAEVLGWATPAQRAALDQLSSKLKLSGDDRAQKVYRQVFGPGRAGRDAYLGPYRAFIQAREDGRRLLFSRWPDLRDPMSSAFAAAEKDAQASLGRWIEEGRFKSVLDADDALTVAEEESYKREIEETRLLRFVRLFKSVVLAHQLRDSGDPAARRRFEKLAAAEATRPAFLDRNTAEASR